MSALLIALVLHAGPPVPVGSLVIVGGGRLPTAARQRFLALAGGKSARIAVIPTASADAERNPDSFLAPWRALAPASVILVHTRNRTEADTAAFAAKLDGVTGIWLSGGDQARIAAAYRGTATHRAIQRVFLRGGVVGGTSAGAAILSDTMIVGGTQQARLGRGLSLFPDAIIDQHFLKRDRFNRLLDALSQRPGLWGLGIDEDTAVVVRGDTIQVIGPSYAVLITPRRAGPPSVRILKEGPSATLARSLSSKP